jgi:hypothetical protein
MTSLSTDVSRPIVREMVRILGEEAVLAALEVKQHRLAALLDGRGRLSERQLDRIALCTPQQWQLWAADAGARLAMTAADRALVASTRAMYEPAPAAVAKPSRAKPTRVSMGRRRVPAA